MVSYLSIDKNHLHFFFLDSSPPYILKIGYISFSFWEGNLSPWSRSWPKSRHFLADHITFHQIFTPATGPPWEKYPFLTQWYWTWNVAEARMCQFQAKACLSGASAMRGYVMDSLSLIREMHNTAALVGERAVSVCYCVSLRWCLVVCSAVIEAADW